MFKADCNSIFQIVKRNMKIYLKDKMALFFSMLTPLIMLLLYVLFLADIQFDSVKNMFEGAENVPDSAIRAVIDNWLIAGVVSVSCMTVALNSMMTLVQDRSSQINYDFIAAPIKPMKLILGYFISFFIVSMFISIIVMCVAVIYLAIANGLYLSFLNVLELFGLLVLSCLSSVMVLMAFVVFFKSIGSFSAFVGIFSAVIGFLIGAYMPVSAFPLGVQYFANILPGSHSSALFRGIFMSGALDNLSAYVNPQAIERLREAYSISLNLFGTTIHSTFMYIYLAASVVIFLGANIVVYRFKKN